MTTKIFYTKVNALEEKDLFEKGLSLVNEDRKSKVLACKMEADQRRSLAAGLLIRYACEKLGYSYPDMIFYKEAGGRPYVEEFMFNVSHSGNIAAIIAGDMPAGIDVEWSGRFDGQRGEKRLHSIMEKIFDDEEKKKCVSKKEAIRIWTCKESYAKANGAGLGMDFSKIHTCSREGWTSYEIEDEYIMSAYLCRTGKIENPVCVHLEEMIG